MTDKEINRTESDRLIQTHLTRRDFEKARELIASRLDEDGEHADPYYWQGIWHYYQGQIGPTIENLKKCLEIDPKHTDAAICLSVLYNDIGKYDQGKLVFEKANQSVIHRRPGQGKEIDRKFSVKHMEMADLYFRYRRFDEAIEEYTKAILLDEDMVECKIRRAKSFAKKGYISRAIQELQEIKNESPELLTARIQLGLLHYSQGDLLEAELEWESVLDLDPKHREAQAYLEMVQKK
ncbi:MAG: hypothetical protein CL678_04245 [Bdellovibrionaceae bacterium]|nr:hypothetical protein [Pseudobdellovibrionaceae bacterium]|tara:strand:- start:1619 stop:2329 length:711 start_codon:yes stop_codon:yes gene_type:complete